MVKFNTFQSNGYGTMDIHRTSHHRQKYQSMREKTVSMVILPYMHSSPGNVTSLLSKYNIKLIHCWQRRVLCVVVQER